MGKFNNNSSGIQKIVKAVSFLGRHRFINKAASGLSNTKIAGYAADSALETTFDSFKNKINVTIIKNLAAFLVYLIAVGIYYLFNNLYISSIIILIVYSYMGIRFLKSLLCLPGIISDFSNLIYCWKFKNQHGYFREITIGKIVFQGFKALSVNAILLIAFGLVAGYVKKYLRKQVMHMYLRYLLIYPIFDSIDFLFDTNFLDLITIG